MINFKKLFTLKIISVIVSIAFLCNASLYAHPESKNTLRISVGEQRTFDRIDDTMHQMVIDEPLAEAAKEAGTPRLNPLYLSNLSPEISEILTLLRQTGLGNFAEALKRLCDEERVQRFSPGRGEWIGIYGHASDERITVKAGLEAAREGAVLGHELLDWFNVQVDSVEELSTWIEVNENTPRHLGPAFEVALNRTLSGDTDVLTRFVEDFRRYLEPINVATRLSEQPNLLKETAETEERHYTSVPYSSLSMEQRFKEAMGSRYENIRNFRIDMRTGRYVFEKALNKKPDVWITYYYENAVPVDLDGSIDDLLALYEESVQEDESNVDIRYLIFKRIAKFRDRASHLEGVLKNIMDTETSDRVLDEIRVAINIVSGRAIDGGKRLRVAYASYEISPFVGKGGIKDVIQQLPRTLHNKRGHEASVFIPYWEEILDKSVEGNDAEIRIEEVGVFELHGERVEIYTLLMRNELTGDFEPIDGVPIYLLKCARYFSTEDGDIYRQALDRKIASHRISPKNAETAIFFSKAVLEAMKQMGLRPDIINTADWQTAHIATLLRKSKNPELYSFFKSTKTLHTIHNIGPKGLIAASPYAPEGSDERDMWDFMGISDDAYQPPDQNGVEFYGSASLQKGGIVFADMVSTVGISYASELKTTEFGSGFEGINRVAGVIGVPNGIALREWNPASSFSIERNFKNDPSEQDRQLSVLDAKEGKRENKKAMTAMVNDNRERNRATTLREFTCDEDTQVFCFLGRFDAQKGLDVLLSVLENEHEIKGLLESGKIKMIFAGTGNPEYMQRVKKLEELYPESVAYLGWVNEGTAKQLFAGADVNIMPSIFEPKGIVQMQAARFGAINLVNKVGGLRDDIIDFSEEEGGNGYVVDFANCSKEEAARLLRNQMLRVMWDFGNKAIWDAQVREVLADSAKFGWDLSCLKYELLFNASTGNYYDLFTRHLVDHIDEITGASFERIMTEIGKAYLARTRVFDPLTGTVMLTGADAKEFLLRSKQFYHETTVCNLDPNPMTVEIDETSVTLDDIGVVAIKPGSSLLFREIKGEVVVIITQNPEAVSSWYAPYDESHDLFKDKGYNESGVISPPEWWQKGVTVIEHESRVNQWTSEQEQEWLIDSMTFGSNLPGISMVRYSTDTGEAWVDFREIRPSEDYHSHPNKPEGQANFIEVYYIVEGMATLLYEEEGVVKVTELGPGGMWIAKDEVPHTILAFKGPYKHLAIQVPSVFQYGFRFKEIVEPPQPGMEEMLMQTQEADTGILELPPPSIEEIFMQNQEVSRGV
ncbi:glycogen synthase [Candidatus Omnitrophota bacterium]